MEKVLTRFGIGQLTKNTAPRQVGCTNLIAFLALLPLLLLSWLMSNFFFSREFESDKTKEQSVLVNIHHIGTVG